jgi:SAM-dependent methyltransferase
LKKEKDIMGYALMEYYKHQVDKPLLVRTSWTDFEEYELPYFFRSVEIMPEIEVEALQLVHGKILDVGAGTGIHSVALKSMGQDVKPIDISPYSVEIMRMRGIEEAEEADFFKLQNVKYDTLLFLMNGIGLVEKLDKFEHFFEHCKSILNPGGQILCDSSDLIYLFEQDDGSFLINLNDDYYGEVDFFVEYDGQKAAPFPWLFVDFENLRYHAEKSGFSAELVRVGAHYDYLARLVLNDK